jgi:hydrogenase nickel incorporation protein HypB
MCEACGCGDPGPVKVELGERILAENERAARHNREHFAERGLLAVNLMGSPGSGKTALLEATARVVAGRLEIVAMSGDLATDHDAARLEAAGIRCHSITTGTACHLDARVVHQGLHHLAGSRPHEHSHEHSHEHLRADVLFIENVGNLVCPAVYDLGQSANVVALSITEGEDKPLKYPVMFRRADLVLVTKLDLLPHLPHVRLELLREALVRTMQNPRFIELSALTGQGIEQWLSWVEERRSALRAPG